MQAQLHLILVSHPLQLHLFLAGIPLDCKHDHFQMQAVTSISQFETEIRAERQMEGILKAKSNGVQFGRSKQLNEKEILELQQQRENGVLIRELMADYRLSKASRPNGHVV
jgi:DNA invertase Pin-like site-specific DNA recombinase